MNVQQELATPFGILRCFDQDRHPVPFQTACMERQYETAVYDEITEKWTGVAPEYQAEILIQTDQLTAGACYTIRLDGAFRFGFGASDENAVSNVITENGCTLSFGAYDPNDDGKDRQAVPVYENGIRIGFKAPDQYDVSKFRGYLLTVLPDWSGFAFQILDHSIPCVKCRIAWIRHSDTIVTDDVHYENAVFVMTTF